MSDARGGYDAELFDRLVALEDASFWFRARNRLIVQLARERVAPGQRMLEIGCGTGYVLRALARDCGLRVTGAELHASGLAHARRRVPEADFAALDARAMPYEQAFDAAGAFDVLEHIDDDVGALRGLHRALRPGGHLLVTVPQHPWLWSEEDVRARHVRRYTRRLLVAHVERAGFAVVRVTSFVTAPLPLMALSRLRGRRREARRERDPLAQLVPPRPLNALLELLLDGERALIRRGVSLPAGGSLALVARRR
jgi:SAM-dependent methyltransferase